MAKPVDEALLSSGSAKADDADASWSGKRDDADRCWTFPMIEGLAAIWNAPTGAPSTSAAAAAPPRQDLIIVALVGALRCEKVTMTNDMTMTMLGRRTNQMQISTSFYLFARYAVKR